MAHTKRTQSGARVPGPRKNNSGLGLVLDDYLQAIADMRRTFKLAKPGFDLSDVESQAAASAAINAIVKETFERHSPEIYSKQQHCCRRSESKSMAIGHRLRHTLAIESAKTGLSRFCEGSSRWDCRPLSNCRSATKSQPRCQDSKP